MATYIYLEIGKYKVDAIHFLQRSHKIYIQLEQENYIFALTISPDSNKNVYLNLAQCEADPSRHRPMSLATNKANCYTPLRNSVTHIYSKFKLYFGTS